MTSLLFTFPKLICLFLFEEIKISKRKIFYIVTFLKEVNLFNYLQSKYLKEKDEIFRIDSQNTYLKLLKKPFTIKKKFIHLKKYLLRVLSTILLTQYLTVLYQTLLVKIKILS